MFPKFQAISVLFLATLDNIFPKIVMSLRAPPHFRVLDNRVFENFILADEPFAKALRIFETCVLVNNNLCKKLVSSLELQIKFDERFEFTSAPFSIADFNLLIRELDNFTFSVLYCFILC